MTGVPVLSRTPIANARLAVEIAWGANLTDLTGASWTWSDVTTDVLIDAGRVVSITVGRQDETTVAQPASCTFALKNASGNYMPNNPLAANWPNVVRNTPVRVRLSLDNGSTWNIRFQGYATGFNPGWDQSTRKAIVTVAAAGISRRLAQGRTPLKSALYRAITNASPAPTVYWPCEDGPASTQVTSGLPGGAPMIAIGTVGFGLSDAPAGSAPLASLTSAGQLRGIVPSVASTSWRVEFAAKFNALAGGDFTACLQVLTNGAVSLFEIDAANTAGGGLYVQWIKNGTPGSSFSNKKIDDALWHWFKLDFQNSGSDIAWFIWVDDAVFFNGVLTGVNVSPIATLIVNPTGATVEAVAGFGHLTAWTPFGASVDTRLAATGYAGETPGARMTRLCAEEGVPFATVGFYDTTQTMGPQGVDTFMNLIRECEAADHGFLYDGLAIGWQYQGISQRYDQATALTLDIPSKHLYDLVPVDDDQRNVNKVTVQRKNGSTAPITQDTTGPLGTNAIGVYDAQVTVNTYDDQRLADRGGWDVHAGTMPGFRYPTLHLNLMRASTVAAGWMSRADGFSGPVVPGCHIDVTNASTVLVQHSVGTVELCLEGYAEQLSAITWDVVGNCSGNRQYDVFKIGDSRLGRLGTDGSTLASSVSAGATSLSVASSGALWTTTATYPADFPFDVEIDGIRVTVTDISGTSSPQAFTVTGATVTKALASGKAVTTWHGGVIKL